MDRSLLLLIGLQIRGGFRRMFRSIRTPSGAILFAIGLGVFGLVIAFAFFSRLVLEEVAPLARDGFGPLAKSFNRSELVESMTTWLLVLSVLSNLMWSGQAIHFRPAEVDFLFAGPFTRRSLLLFKLSQGALGAAIAAVFFATAWPGLSVWWPAATLGVFLALLFIQLFSTAQVLIGQSIAIRASTRARKLILLILLLALAVGLWQAFPARGRGLLESLLQVRKESWLLKYGLAPLDVFGYTMTAQSLFPDLLGWAALALVIDLALLLLALWLDANYIEAALATSQRLHDVVQRLQRGDPLALWNRPRKVRGRVPQLGWLAGAGPILWRQLVSAHHSGRGLIAGLLLMVAPAVLVLLPSIASGPADTSLPLLTMPIIFFTFMITFDFRRELDHMDWLKTLPLKPSAIAVGELMAPVLIATALEALLGIGVGLIRAAEGGTLLVAAVFLLPVNVFLFGVENLFFLLFPMRRTAAMAGDFRWIGRAMLGQLVKTLAWLCGGLAAALAGGAGYAIGGGSWALGVALAWLTIVAMALGTVPCVAWAFRRFDVSRDTPA